MCVDLHIHSIYSDGTAYPSELVRMAVHSGLRCIALTDHDTVDGIDELIEHGRNNSLEVIPGLEISATHRELSMHILGYGIDHHNPELVDWLTRLQQGRTSRNEKIIQRLQQLGLDVTNEELLALSRTGQAGRPHIAQLLVNKNIVKSTADAFKYYLRKGAPAWASRLAYSAAQSIKIIHNAGGIAVLAHPGHLAMELKTLPLLMRELVERGLDGIEIYYPGHSNGAQKDLWKLARKYNLVVTGGSDYHGDNKKFSEMAGSKNGFCPPDDILDHLFEKIDALRKGTG